MSCKQMETLTEKLLTYYQQFNLAAWDLMRIVKSECVHQHLPAQCYEVRYHDTTGHPVSHYWIQCALVDVEESISTQEQCIWFDCGRINAYEASLCLVNDTELIQKVVKERLEFAILSTAQIDLLCMQNAHFDHC